MAALADYGLDQVVCLVLEGLSLIPGCQDLSEGKNHVTQVLPEKQRGLICWTCGT